jgi:hypothetical protein
MASFDGVSFNQKAYDVPWEGGIQVSERPIAAGTDVIIDVGGVEAEHMIITAYFESDAARAAMRVKERAKTQGTLVCVDGTFTVLFTRMRRSRRFPNDQQFAELYFTIIS